jgi:hypothetical protein
MGREYIRKERSGCRSIIMCLCYKTAILMDPDEFASQTRGWMTGTQPWPAMDEYADWLGLSPATILGYTFFKGALESVVEARAAGEGPDGWERHERIFKEEYLPRHKVKDDVEWTIGLWGGPEPSFNAAVKGKRKNVLALAADWGKNYNQDAMAILFPSARGQGARLRWELGKEASDEQLDALLGALAQVNKQMASYLAEQFNLYEGFNVGVTVKGNREIEYWASNEDEAVVGKRLIDNALEMAELAAEYDRFGWSG